MSKKANTILIGTFTILAIVLFTCAVVLFSSGSFFRRKLTFYTFFNTSLNGLDVGAPVKFRGIQVGNVKNIEILHDSQTGEALTTVIFDINANLFKTIDGNRLKVTDYSIFYNEQIGRGLAAKVTPESILTGKLYIGINYFPQTQPRSFKPINFSKYQQMPAVATSMDEFLANMDIIIKKISKADFPKLTQRAILLIDTLNAKVRNFNFSKVNEAMESLSNFFKFDSGTRQSLDDALTQFTQACRSVRLFLEYLERNPNALIAGKEL